MKRTISAALAGLLLLSLCACAAQQQVQDPVNFYYKRSNPVYGESYGLIAPQVREGVGHEDDLHWLLSQYLKGPKEDGWVNVFPTGTALVSVQEDGDTLTVTLSDHFAQLTGLELTIACACLTLSVLEWTQATAVTVCAQNQTLDGASGITMNRDCLFLLDSSADPAYVAE